MEQTQWLDESAVTPRQARRVREISRRLSSEANSLLQARASLNGSSLSNLGSGPNPCPYVETVTPVPIDVDFRVSLEFAPEGASDSDSDADADLDHPASAKTGAVTEDADFTVTADATSDDEADPDLTRSHRSGSTGEMQTIAVPPRTVPLWRWLQKKRVPTESFDAGRRSLPSLDLQDTALLGQQLHGNTLMPTTIGRTSSNANMSTRPKMRATLDEKEVSMFFATDSPMMPSEDVATPQESTVRQRMSLSRPAVFTEVADSMLVGMSMYRKHGSQSDYKVPHGASTPDTMPTNPRSNVPRLAMQETQMYTFAIILRHTEEIFRILRRRFPSKSSASIRRDLDQQVSQLQQKAVRRLIQSGLGVLVLDNDIYEGDHDDQTEEQAAMNICVLVNPKKDPMLLVHEFKREMDELAILQGEANGHMAEESIDSIKQMCFSPALELQLTHNIIQNAFKDYDKEEWVIDVNRELTVKDVIKDCFPLHDRQFNKKFFAAYRKNTFTFNIGSLLKGNRDRWAIEELRLHFGERVAFLFAFMHIYSKYLTPLTIVCCCYYLAFRFLPSYIWKQYMEGLAVLGFIVACMWAPGFLLSWQRETHVLVEKWNLAKYKNTVYEKNDYNPEFEYVWVKNELTHEMEKIPAARKNHLIQMTMFFYVLLSALLQCICIMPFIQWYVYAKNAPSCAVCQENLASLSSSNKLYTSLRCVWFVNCFTSETSHVGTDRWFYILVQGIVLGLLIDIIFFEVFNWISERFVKWENYRNLSDYENRLIHRRFVFVWSNWFFWFLFIAFVYLPFGKEFLELFQKSGLRKLAPMTFEPGTLTLDTLFVTPLVVTQFLNMILETFIPYLIRKLRGRPTTCNKTSPITWFARHICSCFRSSDKKDVRVSHDSVQARFLTAKRLARLIQQRSGLAVDVKAYADDSNAYSAYEIVAESKLPMFDPVLDYLDACIQFSYVVMFTVVWPLLPLPAVLNNVLEVRGDAFRLLFAHRRPMPRRDTSIGEWATVLMYANLVGIIAVMGFIAMYHYGFFVTSDCNFQFGDGFVVPFSTLNLTKASNSDSCRDQQGDKSSSPSAYLRQLVVFLLLEHIGFLIRYLVLQVDKVPSALRSSGYKRLKQVQRLTNARAAPASQFEYIQQLKALFDKYDVNHDGHLREPHLIAFIAEWICKHPTELMPYSSIIFRYMDKNGLGKIPFSTCCLMLQHVNHDRFFSCLLGLYDPEHAEWNSDIRNAEDGISLHRVMSEVSSFVSHRNSAGSPASNADARSSFGRARDSSFFYVN